jgi:hypothetical protein
MRFRVPKSSALALALLAASWGCGAAGQGALPSLIPIKGKITYKGQALTTGFVRFKPDGSGRIASGQLQSDGTYVLSTLQQSDGVVAGSYRVYIADPDKKLASDRTFKKYLQANNSKLTADVTPESTEFNFDLK